MLNFLIVSTDQYLTKELALNLGKENIITPTADYKAKVSNALNITPKELVTLTKDNLDTYYNLQTDKYSKFPILVCIDENKPLNPKTLKSLRELLVNSYHAKKKRTIMELQTIGYNFKLRGTQYLLDLILELHKNDEILLNNLQNTLYPTIAKKYGKTPTDIKNCIISATDNMYAECDATKFKKYFCLCDDEKPSIKRIIYTIANKVYQ